MASEVIQVSEINLPAIQADIFTLQEQLTSLIECVRLTNTILLYFIAVLATVGVCVLLYKFLRLFF